MVIQKMFVYKDEQNCQKLKVSKIWKMFNMDVQYIEIGIKKYMLWVKIFFFFMEKT